MTMIQKQSILKSIFSRRMLSAFIMGFSCGLPLLLTLTVLQAWMKDEGVDLTVIGLINLVGLPYTLKFLWAPLLDRYSFPFLGRRRGWLLMAQVFLMMAIFGLGMTNPAKHPLVLALRFSGHFFQRIPGYRGGCLPKGRSSG